MTLKVMYHVDKSNQETIPLQMQRRKDRGSSLNERRNCAKELVRPQTVPSCRGLIREDLPKIMDRQGAIHTVVAFPE